MNTIQIEGFHISKTISLQYRISPTLLFNLHNITTGHLCSLMLEQWNTPQQNLLTRFHVTYLRYVYTNLHPGHFKLCPRTTRRMCTLCFCYHCLCSSNLANVLLTRVLECAVAQVVGGCNTPQRHHKNLTMLLLLRLLLYRKSGF